MAQQNTKTSTNQDTEPLSQKDQTLDLSVDIPASPAEEIEKTFKSPKVEDVIEVMQDPETITRIQYYAGEVTSFLLTWNVFIEITLIGTALIAGWAVRKFSMPYIQKRIDTLKAALVVKHTLRNLTRLTLHFTALIILLICAGIISTLRPEWGILLVSATIKLLSAWIFIRLVAQFIVNSFLRNIIATFAWTVASLSIIGLLGPVMSILDSIGFTMGETRLSLLSVMKAGIIISLLLSIAMFVGKVSEQKLRRSTSLTPSSRVLISKLIKITLIAIAFLFGVTLAGLDLSSLAIFGGALGLGLGFGLQKVISNLFSGILLLADRSIKPGDIIEMPNGTFGWIGQLNARYVSIVTRENKEYLVPNEDFITQPVINWSYTDRLIRVETKFGVHYNSDPHQIKELAEAAAAGASRTVPEPPPVCHLVEFGDSSLNFVLRYWIEDAEKGVTNTKGEVMLALWDSFKEHGIEIPYPHREVYIHQPKD
jgi:small-conductance mechanosensitive channel